MPEMRELVTENGCCLITNILYTKIVFFKIEGKVQIFFFLDEQETGQLIASRPALHKMEKKVLGTEGKYTDRIWYLNPGMKNTKNRKSRLFFLILELFDGCRLFIATTTNCNMLWSL